MVTDNPFVIWHWLCNTYLLCTCSCSLYYRYKSSLFSARPKLKMLIIGFGMGINWPARLGYKNKPLQSRDWHICHFIWQNKRDSMHVVKGDKRGIILCFFSFLIYHVCLMLLAHVCYFHFALVFNMYVCPIWPELSLSLKTPFIHSFIQNAHGELLGWSSVQLPSLMLHVSAISLMLHVSAISLMLHVSAISLTLYHTMWTFEHPDKKPYEITFDALKIYSCGKHCEKKLLVTGSFSFSRLIFHFNCTLKCCLQLF